MTNVDRREYQKRYYREHRLKWNRFVTREEQKGKRRNNRNLTFQGKTQYLALWAREIGVSRQVLDQRLKKYGWSIEKALTTPLLKQGRPRNNCQASLSKAEYKALEMVVSSD